MKQLCAHYKIRDEEFADEWAAFISAPNISSEITGTSLDKFERNRQSVGLANQIKLDVKSTSLNFINKLCDLLVYFQYELVIYNFPLV